MKYYVLTNGDSYILTNTNPYSFGLVDYSIHEFDGLIPDLNTHIWNGEIDEFVLNTRILTPLQFLNKFTTSERIAILESTNPVVKDFVYLLNSTTSVTLDSQNTIDGINYLAFVGLITSVRAAEILT